MKTRLLIALVLSTFGLAMAASPGTAQKPIPGIKATASYKSLQRYVGFLKTRRNTPVTGTKRSTYRRNLATRRGRADTKVVNLYRQKLNRLSKQDDRWQRRRVMQIRRTEQRRVESLNRQLDQRLAGLQARRAAAIIRVGDRFNPGINRLANRRDRLRRRLAKTSRPSKRAALVRRIRRIQNNINDLVDERNAELANVNSRYDGLASGVTDLFNARIARAHAAAKREIAEAAAAWRRTFRVQVRAAKIRRDGQKDLVRALSARGTGYINSMPSLV